MTSHSAFELEVLDWVTADYEAPHTISSDIARELKRPISETETRAALIALAQSGMVQAYIYEAQNQRFKPVTSTEAAAEKEPWFMATPKGIAELERHAS